MRGVAALALTGVVGLAVGCGSGGLPVTRYYTLSQPGAGAAPAAAPDASGWTLAVESLDVATPYDQDRVVYRAGLDSTEVGFYSYHRWAAPLGRLAQAALIEELRKTPGVRSAAAMGSSAQFDARLAGRVVYLEEVGGASGQQARVSIELELHDRSAGVLWSETFTGSEAGPFADGGDVAVGLHRVFRRLIGEAGGEIAAALVAVESR